jgi:hypothetical protein
VGILLRYGPSSEITRYIWVPRPNLRVCEDFNSVAHELLHHHIDFKPHPDGALWVDRLGPVTQERWHESVYRLANVITARAKKRGLCRGAFVGGRGKVAASYWDRWTDILYFAKQNGYRSNARFA